ncbi:hypothetical protein PIB30_039457 [Stylosanthes scabra]|uniref:Uncharacterized protein n=1 Tax=Stylosanthes scabra TaxID=79078 RepID=A0ABU6VFS1_9FABA|nr:hypothetical protein [Stylosanthes scabra]
MPIYHDYHGDSRGSSISTWDQIQIILKSLLPSYEPILCDSTLATTRSSKFKFNQNPSSSRIAPAKINVQIHPDQSKNHHSEYEIQEEETIQNTIEITDPSTIQHSDLEFTNITKPELHSQQQNTSQFQIQSQEVEDEFYERSIYYGCDDRSTTILVQRPPLEPPDLNSVAVGEGDLASAVFMTEEGDATLGDGTTQGKGDARPMANSSTEDGAVVKEKAEIADLDMARAGMVQRPPPKLPHLNPYKAALGDSSTVKILVAGRIGAMDDGGEQDTSINVVSTEEMQTWVTTVVEGELTTSAEVDASAKEKRRRIIAGVDVTMTEGGFKAR